MVATASSTSSAAALCTVTVSKDVLQADFIVALLLKLLETTTHQVVVKTVPKPKSTLSLSLLNGGGDGALELTQRNAILRSLCGTALHGAMDSYRNTVMLSGGTFSISASCHCSGSATQAQINAGATIQWMSVADSIRNNSNGLDESILDELNATLQNYSYVVPYASTCSLVDLDLCMAVLSSPQANGVAHLPTNVQRWLNQTSNVLIDLSNQTGVEVPANLQQFISSASQQQILPIFFDGTEDVDATLSVISSSGGGNKKKANNIAKQQQKPEQNKSNQDGGAAAAEGGGNKKLTKAEKNAMKKANKAANKEKNAAAGEDGNKTAGGNVAATYNITALDIRVGKIVKAWEHAEAEKLYCEEIDLGPELGVRNIASGLRPFYKSSDDLTGRHVLVLCNLKKRNLVGFPSHGMVLCASNADHTAIELVVPSSDDGVTPGDRIVFESSDPEKEASPVGDAEPENKVAKKKIFEQLAPDLRTNDDGIVAWKSMHIAKTSGSTIVIKALNGMANASVS